MNNLPETYGVLLYVIIFIGALLTFEGARQLVSRNETRDEARNRRMRLKRAGVSSEQIFQELFVAERRGHSKRLPDIGRALKLAGLRIKPSHFVLLSGLLGIVAFLIMVRYMPTNLAALFAAGLTLLAPAAFLTAVKRKRMEKLVEQLPDALDLMARGLKVGHPLNVTVASVATEMSDPIGSEFGLLVDQVSFGTEIADAFSDLADRTGLEDTRSLAVSVGIQHGTGGNLARVLNVLSKVIRDRATMRRKISAISAEGRLSAFILSVLPFGIFGSIYVTTPNYYLDVMDDPVFMPAAIIIVSLVVLQALILRHLVTFKF
jgi:tight adherence protein B